MKKKLMAVLTLGAGALALAACGSSSSSTSTSSSTSASSTTSTSASTGDATAFCGQVDVLKSLDSTFSSLAPNDISGAQTAFQTADDALNKAADLAPAEIKSDADAVATAFDTLNEKIQGVSTPAEVQALGPELKPIVQALQTHIKSLQAFAKDNC
jgi:hypothetical protein